MRVFILLLSISLFLIPGAKGEIVNCDGEWTNKTCEKKVIGSLPEKELDPRVSSVHYPEKKQIISAISAFTAELLNLGIVFPSQELREKCLLESTSVEDCQGEFDSAQNNFRPALDAAQRRKENAVPPSSASSSQGSIESSELKNDSTTVTIIDPIRRWPYDYDRRPPRRKEDRWRDEYWHKREGRHREPHKHDGEWDKKPKGPKVIKKSSGILEVAPQDGSASSEN